MKMTTRFFSLAVTVAGLTSVSYGQETASATATASIVTPISISKDVDMNFGNAAVRSTLSGTVVLATGGARSVTGGVTLPALSGTITAAPFTVNGQADYTYAIMLPVLDVTIDDGATHTMTVNNFTCSPAATAGLLTAGMQTLNVGATLNIEAAQAAETYVSATPFDVTIIQLR